MVVALAFLLLAGTGPLAAELHVSGWGAVRFNEIESQASWLEGGFGRMALSGDAADEADETATGVAHLVIDWQPSALFGAFVHVTGRAEPNEHEGRAAGLVEAFLTLSPRIGATQLNVSLGQMLPPTTQENIDTGWASPYTIHFSALNSWIGEELRITGLLADADLPIGSTDTLRLSAGAFQGNDTLGALLAWRGWSFGDRLTGYGEVLPLPPLDSLTTGGFAVQRPDGTQPLGADLDDRLGWLASARYRRPETLTIQLTHFDNRGDRGLHGQGEPEYAWNTQFDQLGITWQPTPSWSLVGEWLTGESGMGDQRFAHVDLDMETAYLLASWAGPRHRVTLRYDTFEIVDRDRQINVENNDEDGDAWTAAYFWQNSRWRLGVEYLDVRGDRPAAAESGFDPDTDGRQLTLEARFFFDFGR